MCLEIKSSADEDFQQRLTKYFELDKEGKSFSYKKNRTSFMRRFIPHGVATEIMMTVNIRALRHIIYMRTALGAERRNKDCI